MTDTANLIAGSAVLLGIIGLSALFSAGETGITAASKSRIHRLAREGSKRAERVEAMLDQKEKLIGSALLGNNLLNTLAAALTTYVLGALFPGPTGALIAAVIVSALVLVLAEVLPKTYALTQPDRTALVLGPMLHLVAKMFNPVIDTVQRLVRWVLRLYGVPVGEDISYLSSHEEVRGMIELHAEEGGLDQQHRHQLGSILDLDEVTVMDVMVHRRTMEMLDLGEPPEAVVKAIVRSNHTRLPVYKDNQENIVGVLHAKDVMRALSRRDVEPEDLNIAEVMSQPWFVPDTTTLREQLNAFIAKRAHFALVVDEYGALQGLITLEDILEEIVGDISDEHDAQTPSGVTAHDDGSFTIEGTVTIRDLNRRFDWRLPDDAATTIAGLVIHEARVIPVKGQSFNFHGFKFDILERRRNQITLLKATPPAREDSAHDVSA
jgi:Mg2+/Co2+ transporter CorB